LDAEEGDSAEEDGSDNDDDDAAGGEELDQVRCLPCQPAVPQSAQS
jgi:hypothetical protein